MTWPLEAEARRFGEFPAEKLELYESDTDRDLLRAQMRK